MSFCPLLSGRGYYSTCQQDWWKLVRGKCKWTNRLLPTVLRPGGCSAALKVVSRDKHSITFSSLTTLSALNVCVCVSITHHQNKQTTNYFAIPRITVLHHRVSSVMNTWSKSFCWNTSLYFSWNYNKILSRLCPVFAAMFTINHSIFVVNT